VPQTPSGCGTKPAAAKTKIKGRNYRTALLKIKGETEKMAITENKASGGKGRDWGEMRGKRGSSTLSFPSSKKETIYIRD